MQLKLEVFLLFTAVINPLCLLIKANNDTVIQLKANIPSVFSISAGIRYTLQLSLVSAMTKFVVFQVHTYQEPVVFNITENGGFGESVTGTNVGGVLFYNLNKSMLSYISSKANIKVLIAAVTYTQEAPIPGGCNLEFELEISPFFHLTFDRNKIALSYQYGSFPSPVYEPMKCERFSNKTSLNYEIYEYFLKESFMSEKELFNSIIRMITVPDINKMGRRVTTLKSVDKTQLFFAALFGQGIIYNVIITNSDGGKSAAAAYVPIATFSCQLDAAKEMCITINEIVASFHKILLIFGGILGLFLCFKGHRFFKTEMFIFGFFTFLLIFYVVIVRATYLEEIPCILVAIALGLLGGMIWLAVWWFLGIPILSVVLVGFFLGFLFACIIFFTPFADFPAFHNDFNYAVTFVCWMLLIPVILLSWTQKMNMIATAVIGSYLAIIAIGQFVNVSLGYFVGFILKRATVENFTDVYAHAPFQLSDIIILLLWLILAFSGFMYQFYKERGRHPFPPHPYLQWKNRVYAQEMLPHDNFENQEETRPLLGERIKSFLKRTKQSEYGSTSQAT